jgi:23S rRNA (cytosine1962-C5)-methyltransferase
MRTRPLSACLPELWPDFRESLIVYEDEDLIIVDKPAGVPSQAADSSHDDDLPARLKRFLAARREVSPEQVYLGTHQRLDRDTSGLVLYTLRREMNAAVAAQFEGRQLTKSYLAGVETRELSLLQGEIVLEHRLARGRDGRMQVVAEGARGGRHAVTRVALRERRDGRALLELGCDTGRTHQLRVQLAHEGAAIAGDRLYGQTKALRLLLHAARLGLCHPRDGRRLEVSAALPFELEHWLEHGLVDATADPTLLRRALELAIDARYRLGRARRAEQATTAFRLFHGGADGAPDLAVDVYGEFLVVHLFGEAIDARAGDVLGALDALGFAGTYLKRHPKQKNDLGDRRDAHHAPAEPARGNAAPDELVIEEHGLPFGVRLGDGLRTGLFLDQRDNRQRVRALSRGKRVLNLFAYTGGFSVAALAGGAEQALSVDASQSALVWAQRNAVRIGAEARHRTWHAEVFDVLAQLARKGERFDLIIVDPPSYSKTRTRRFLATKDYSALCEACMRVLAPAGQVLCCINHHGVSQAKLRRDVRRAAEVAGRAVVQLKDLPTQLDFPAEQGQEPQTKSVLLACD